MWRKSYQKETDIVNHSGTSGARRPSILGKALFVNDRLEDKQSQGSDVFCCPYSSWSVSKASPLIKEEEVTKPRNHSVDQVHSNWYSILIRNTTRLGQHVRYAWIVNLECYIFKGLQSQSLNHIRQQIWFAGNEEADKLVRRGSLVEASPVDGII